MSLSPRSIPTADRISDLHDSILCHILSFLPTNLASITSILSKRWKSLWLSVFTLNFDHESFQDFNSFHKFVFLTMFSLRDKKISIHSFTFKCGQSSRFNQKELNIIFKFVMHRGVKNLNFNMSNKKRQIKLPPCILGFNKTLRFLKLGNVQIRDFDQVDFPCVKTLHLNKVTFISHQYIVKFLLGCPVLEDLHTKSLVSKLSLVPMENLNPLLNLVEVRICCDLNTPMTLICKTKILHVEQSKISWTRLPVFYNLTHMELSIHDTHCDMECTSLLGMLPHFPNLQYLIIQDNAKEGNICYNFWKHPLTVPKCLSSQLKTCCIRCYKGTKHEFDFAEYIMHHSKVLETMKIQSNCLEMDQVLVKLYSNIRGGSTACKILFDYIDNDVYTMFF